jgi:tRNA threonylcarbamoyladenosine biosynthesis protein TsaE
MDYISKSEAETKEIAAKLAEKLKGGEILALHGDLGAGKTTFTKGLAAALGIKRDITSPTFVIMKKYDAFLPPIDTLVHVDAYRLSSKEDVEAIGLFEIFEDNNTVTVIEWPENIDDALLEEKTIRIDFEYLNQNERKISISKL